MLTTVKELSVEAGSKNASNQSGVAVLRIMPNDGDWGPDSAESVGQEIADFIAESVTHQIFMPMFQALRKMVPQDEGGTKGLKTQGL